MGLEDDVEPEMVSHTALASVIPITSGKTSEVCLTFAIWGVVVLFSFGMGYWARQAFYQLYPALFVLFR